MTPRVVQSEGHIGGGTRLDEYRRGAGKRREEESVGMGLYMLWTAAGTFVLIWLLAMGGVVAAGGWVHLLLVVAMGMMALTVFSRPRPIT
jgi:hypothetical protein